MDVTDLFKGRIARRNYALGLLFCIGGLFLLLYTSKWIWIAGIIGLLSLLPLALLVLSLHVRRLHDQGNSGWWILLGPIAALLNLIAKSQVGANQYGEPPAKEVPFFDAIFNLQLNSKRHHKPEAQSALNHPSTRKANVGIEKLKEYKYILLILLISSAFAFYWHDLRPYLIKKGCFAENAPDDQPRPEFNSLYSRYLYEQHLANGNNYTFDSKGYQQCLLKNGL